MIYLHYIQLLLIRTSIKHKFNKILVVTRSKGRLRQSPVLKASLRNGEDYCPGKVVKFREDNAVVEGHSQEGSPSPIFTWSQSTAGFGIFKCKDKRCLTCPKYNTEHKFKSNITQKK